MAREWAYGLSYRSHHHRNRALPHWLEHYNTRRPHSGIGNRPPNIDWSDGVLLVRESKFMKSRHVPLQESTLQALQRYARRRDELCPNAREASFFVSLRGTRLLRSSVEKVFRVLCESSGVGADAPLPPRVHDLRHTFAVKALLGWYRGGADVQARLHSLSTYMGHRQPRSTYLYLSAAPELLAYAAGLLEAAQAVTP
jgi:integrase/recombinase XerD